MNGTEASEDSESSEEPELFNRTVQDFLTAVASGEWQVRDLDSITGKIL